MGDMLQESAAAGFTNGDAGTMESWQDGASRPTKRSRLSESATSAVPFLGAFSDQPGNGRHSFNLEEDLDPVALGLCDEAWGRKMFDR